MKQMQITDTLNSADNQTCTYSYDDLVRITSANCGTAWSQTFGFDPFGNLSKSGSAQFLPHVYRHCGRTRDDSNKISIIKSPAVEVEPRTIMTGMAILRMT
jgi:hypothetical protein